MKFSDLERCPFCGCDEYYEKQQVRGSTIYYMRFDGEETDNEDMYAGLSTVRTGRTYCAICNKYIGNSNTNTVGINAEKQLSKKE